MKRLNYLLGCFLSLSILIGCSKDENHVADDKSKDLYAAFNIKMGSVGTKTDVGQPEESTLVNVHIYIFEGDILHSNGGIVMNGTIGATTLAVTEGEKTVYALINSISNIPLPIVENDVTTLDAFRGKIKLIEIENDDDIAKPNKFLMFGMSKATITKANNASETLAKADPVVIRVNRVSSKVSLVFDGPNVGKNNLKGDFSDVKFTLNQTHTMVDVSRELREGDVTSNVGEINYIFTDPTTPTDGGNGTYNHLHRLANASDDANYKAASLTLADASAVAKSHYCLENINEKPVTGNSTFVIVKLKFTPKNGKISADGDFSDYAKETTLNSATGDFWIVTLHDLKYIFASEGDANDAVVDPLHGGKIQKHEGGYCYYRLNLRDQTFTKDHMTKRYAVLRNAVYRVDIKNVKGVGEGKPDDLIPIDPTSPLEDETSMAANIEIIDWTVVIMDEDLD